MNECNGVIGDWCKEFGRVLFAVKGLVNLLVDTSGSLHSTYSKASLSSSYYLSLLREDAILLFENEQSKKLFELSRRLSWINVNALQKPREMLQIQQLGASSIESKNQLMWRCVLGIEVLLQMAEILESHSKWILEVSDARAIAEKSLIQSQGQTELVRSLLIARSTEATNLREEKERLLNLLKKSEQEQEVNRTLSEQLQQNQRKLELTESRIRELEAIIENLNKQADISLEGLRRAEEEYKKERESLLQKVEKTQERMKKLEADLKSAEQQIFLLQVQLYQPRSVLVMRHAIIGSLTTEGWIELDCEIEEPVTTVISEERQQNENISNERNSGGSNSSSNENCPPKPKAKRNLRSRRKAK